MKVSAALPFQIVYSLYQHEYIGYLFESFVIHLDENGKLTLQHQNISGMNASEFAKGLDETDYELIDLMDSMQQDAVVKKFNTKGSMKADDFFLKIYDKEKGNGLVQQEIENYLERKRAQILERLQGKMVFEMGNDGEPAWKEIEVLPEKATILFHFRRNDDNTHYFPTIKYGGEKVDFQYRGSYIVCKEPAWMVSCGKLYSFEKNVDGKKLLPFLNKKFIIIPKNVEETYYNKFVAPLIASFDVYAKGFEINSEHFSPQPVLTISELMGSSNGNLYEQKQSQEVASKMLFELSFKYGQFQFKSDHLSPVSVSVEKKGDDYVFHRVKRKLDEEKSVLKFLIETGLALRNSKVAIAKTAAFGWLDNHRDELIKRQFIIDQKGKTDKKYFIGEYKITVEVKESIDWFDIHALIKFGEYEISFKEIRKLILKKKMEFELPNGEIAVIPDSWLVEYSELFAFSEEDENGEPRLKKHHLSLVKDLEDGNLARVTISNKLEGLRAFEGIDKADAPRHFKGQLRPYQKAGYEWMQFLNKFKFGGCLADDMGLGKTVQTLALLQSQKEEGAVGASLLVMPTSLVYNWEMEAKKFTPKLKTFTYTGTNREKNPEKFAKYDVVITSYGIVRLDISLLKKYRFNYVILDESQAIKNPNSNIAKAVRELNSRRRLILTGTPLENSTMDLWSQMNFINPGLLGTQSFFKNEFLNPIEKQGDQAKTEKLYSIIKPFILRRHKSQVATELPEKTENIQYSAMLPDQEAEYDKVKSHYRNEILGNIEKKGLNKSQIILLQGLTKLRQIANHPKMVDDGYEGTSGKLWDVAFMLDNAITEGHKILVFSQFVKHLSIISDHLDTMNIDYAYLDGSTKNRQEQVERFQNDKDLKVFLISLKAGGLGLNLTKADYVFILDPWWNPAAEAQAIDRAHRIGQVNKVFTYKFITKNTVEEKILALQQHKRKLASELITTESSFVKSLSREDIESLLS